MVTPALPSPPDQLPRARLLGTIQLHRRITALRDGQMDGLRHPATSEEAFLLCEQLVRDLRAASTPEEQEAAFQALRTRTYELYQALGPTPAPVSDEPIPEGLAGYRPAEVLRICHRAEAEIRRLHEGNTSYADLAAEAGAAADDALADVLGQLVELEHALEDANSSPATRADRAEEHNALEFRLLRNFDRLANAAGLDPADADEPPTRDAWAADDTAWRGDPPPRRHAP